MGKKLKSIGLVLFSICCAIGFSTKVNAETIVLKKDTIASDIELSDGVVIDGQGKYTITGGLSIKDGMSVTIKKVTMDGFQEANEDDHFTNILISISEAGDVVIDNVTFKNFDEKAIYGDSFKSLTVTNSSFDCAGTEFIDNNDYGDNPDAQFMYRSGSGIDLNLGNGGKTINVESITIKDNTFKNVVVEDEDKDTSTAGAIKIKVKNATNLEKIGTIRIEGNTFENNERDLVLGTNDPTEGTEASATADLDVLLVNNSKMNVGNFSTAERAEEVLEGNYKLNYTDSKKYALDENLNYIIDENNMDTLTDEELAKILEDQDVAGLAVDYQGVRFVISKETLADGDLGAALDEFNIVSSETTTIEDLKKYEGEGVAFFTVTGIDLLEDGITYDISSLGEEYAGTLYLYYYDETNGLQLVANPEDAILTFDKNGTYVLSAENLIPSTPSEEVPETPSEDVPEVPQTFDSLGMYAGFGIIGALGITGAVLYLKRRA